MAETPDPQQQQIPVARTDEYRIVFANSSRLRMAVTEISLTFGYVDEIPGTGQFLQELVTLVLTPQHAKLLALSLTEAMRLYEERFGTVSTDIQTAPPVDPAKLQEAISAAKKR